MAKKETLLGGAIWALGWLLILLPVALAFLFVYLYGVTVVHVDQWEIIPRFEKLSLGTLGVSDLFAPHNQHRMLFPWIIMLGLGTITKYNNVAEMYFTLACFLGMLTALILVFRGSIKPRLPFLLPVFFVPIAFLVFSLIQHENMLWGFQLQFGLVQVSSVLALCLLYFSGYERLRKLVFPAALTSATVATFSAASGLFVWWVGLLQLLIGPVEKPTKKWLVGAWGLIGVGEWIVYFSNNSQGASTPLLRLLLTDPIAGTKFFLTSGMESFLTLLGHSLFGQQSLAFVSGMLLLGLVAVATLLLYRDRDFGGSSFWIALVLFSLLTLASITVGRLEYYGETPFMPKYNSFSIPAVIGIYVVLLRSALSKKSYLTTALLGSLSALIMLSVPFSYSEGVKAGRATALYREEAAFILATYETQPDALLGAFHLGDPQPELVREERAPILEALGYNVFSEPQQRRVLPPPLSELSPVHSATPNETMVVPEDKMDQDWQTLVTQLDNSSQANNSSQGDKSFVEVAGWAVDAEAEDVAGGVYLDIDGKLFPAYYGEIGIYRQELADSVGMPPYGGPRSWFQRAIPVSEIGTGKHEMSVIVLTRDRERYYQPDKEVSFEIR